MLTEYEALETISIGTATIHAGGRFKIHKLRGQHLVRMGKAAPVSRSTGAASPAPPPPEPEQSAAEEPAPEPKKARKKKPEPEPETQEASDSEE